MGYRYVDGKEAFMELVAINIEVTTPVPAMQRIERMEPDRVNRNVSMIDVESRMLIVYDEQGNVTKTYLGEEFAEMFPDSRVFCEQFSQSQPDSDARLIAPLFDFATLMSVPQSSSPHPSLGRSVYIGNRYFSTNTGHTHVELWTYSFPNGMGSIDTHITNAWGDDFITILSIGPWREVRHTIRFRGEPYGARVSSAFGNFNNVQLRFFAVGQAAPSTVTVTLNANGGSVSPTSLTRTPGSTYGSGGSLPTPTRSGRRFIDWFNTSATTGGTRIKK
jgi:hypothetical protein